MMNCSIKQQQNTSGYTNIPDAIANDDTAAVPLSTTILTKEDDQDDHGSPFTKVDGCSCCRYTENSFGDSSQHKRAHNLPKRALCEDR